MKKHWGLLVVLLLSFWAIRPLLGSGFFPMHDDTQVVRVQQMALALQDGQFPVRWVADLGYGFGYPVFNFYAPLAFYFGGFLVLLGLNALLATKLMFIFGVLLAGVSMYFLARELWGETGGVISGLFYLYAPYHALDIYVRGAVGEFWAMVFLPLVFLAIYKLFEEKKAKWVIAGGLALAAVILSHNLTTMMLVPFLGLLFLGLLIFSENKKKFLAQACCLVFLALDLAAFYWLPALSEMGLTKVFGQVGGGADWPDHFVFVDQLWASPWGFGGSAPGRLDGMSFMVGKLHLVLVGLAVISALALFLKKKSRQSRPVGVIGVALLVFGLTVFLTNQTSWLIWQTIAPMAFIQYPWRFLIFVTLAASFLAGSLMIWLKKKPKLMIVLGALLVLAALGLNQKYFQPQYLMAVSEANYINEENIKWKTSKISDEYLPKDFLIPENEDGVAWEKVIALSEGVEIKTLSLKSHRYDFETSSETEAEVLVNLAYFPGWQVWVDGEKADFSLEEGKIRLVLPEGEHRILLSLTDTPVRIFANIASFTALMVLGALVLKWLRHERN